MKKIIIFILLSLNSLYADTLKVYSFDPQKFKEVGAYLGIRISQEKAYIGVWGRVVVNNEELIQEYILKPKYLQFDTQTKEIFISQPHHKTICGVVVTRGRRLYRKTYIEETGLCQFQTNANLEVLLYY